MTRTALQLLALGAPAALGVGMLHYGYQLMAETALLLVAPVALWVAANIALILWSQRRGGALARIGELYGTVFKYTALFHGLLLVVFVIWPIAVLFGWDDPPASSTEFLVDLTFGALYVSAFVLGIGGGLSSIFTAGRAATRGLAVLYTGIGLGLPIAVAFGGFEATLQDAAIAAPVAYAGGVIGYLLVAGVLGMVLVLRAGAERARMPATSGLAALDEIERRHRQG